MIVSAKKTCFSLAVSALFLAAAPFEANAAPLDLLYENEFDAFPGGELFLQHFSTSADLINDTPFTQGFSQLDVAGDFSIAGFTYNSGGYHLLFQKNVSGGPGEDLFIQTFSTRNDLLNGTGLPGAFSQIDVANDFSVNGFTFDGSEYHLLYEKRAGAGAGDEFFVQSFSSLNNIINNIFSFEGFSQLDISDDLSVAGLTFDGSEVLMVQETDTDSGPGDLFLQSFTSLNDLINGTLGSGSASQINVADDFSIAGLATVAAVKDGGGGSDVPEPGTLALFALGFGGLGFLRRKLRA